MSSLKFPIVISGGATQVTKNESEDIKQNITARLLNQRQSIAFQRDFGSRVHFMLFERDSNIQRSLINYFVREALRTENRILTKNVLVTSENGNVLVDYSYYNLRTQGNENTNLTF